MKSMKWEGIGTKNQFPHISSMHIVSGLLALLLLSNKLNYLCSVHFLTFYHITDGARFYRTVFQSDNITLAGCRRSCPWN